MWVGGENGGRRAVRYGDMRWDERYGGVGR